MPTFRLETERGEWLTDMRLSSHTWRPGDRIPHGRGTLEVVEVRETGDTPTLVVRRADWIQGCGGVSGRRKTARPSARTSTRAPRAVRENPANAPPVILSHPHGTAQADVFSSRERVGRFHR